MLGEEGAAAPGRCLVVEALPSHTAGLVSRVTSSCCWASWAPVFFLHSETCLGVCGVDGKPWFLEKETF